MRTVHIETQPTNIFDIDTLTFIESMNHSSKAGRGYNSFRVGDLLSLSKTHIFYVNCSHMQISRDPGSHDPDPGPQEKSMKKSCVSFATECRNYAL